ncbi:MAG TPA: hypothetical protein PLL88_06665 [Anaerolineaceae bacterium]|nr:hypothetical protein [Anaerolineaceae bacterium]
MSKTTTAGAKTEVRVEIYKNKHDLKKGMKKEQDLGWTVLSVQNVPQGYGCFKTGCLGLVFLPLALLGRKPEKYQVTYQRQIAQNPNH